ncbi:hypothetical protein HDE_11032 [Halotydeus destructor]|nr:hypothetical protein HDE_11032 [Halotydeus destructor]
MNELSEGKRKRKILIVKVLNVVYCLGCGLGCAIQMYAISHVYFLFETVVRLNLTIPGDLEAPDLSLCFRYTDLFDVELFNRRNPSSVPLRQVRSRELHRAMESRVTIRDIFDYTPDTETIIKTCLIRLPQKYGYREPLAKTCNDQFRVTNFYVQEYICYKFEWLTVRNRTYQYRNVAYSLAYAGLFYELDFDRKIFAKALHGKAIVHTAGTFPFSAILFAPSFSRKVNMSTGRAKYNRFYLSYTKVITTRQPPPYSTMCKHYDKLGLFSANGCAKQCLVPGHSGPVGQVPNATVAQTLWNIESECARLCSDPDCDEDYTLTRIFKYPQLEGMTFQVNVPLEPIYHIIYDKRMELTEYMIYVFSLFGTWFGLSVNLFNPFQDGRYNMVKCCQRKQTARGQPRLRRVYCNYQEQFKGKAKQWPSTGQTFRNVLCTYCSTTQDNLRKDMKKEFDTLIRQFAFAPERSLSDHH